MYRIKKYVAHIIRFIPLNFLRCFLYKSLTGYTINKSKIGFGTMICVREAKINNCNIGKFNRFTGPMKIDLSGAKIGSFNEFDCGKWTLKPAFKEMNLNNILRIEDNTHISHHHFFDIAGNIIIKKGTWIAGKGSQFWTHGGNIGNSKNRDIIIGESCYIGSACRIAPGAIIGNNILVGMGSVVSSRFEFSNAMIAGVPARIVKKNYNWKLRKEMD